MKLLSVNEFLTLDGVMQGPGSPTEDTEGGFRHGGWQLPYFDEDAERFISDSMLAADSLLLGRLTYQIFAAYWPTAPDSDPIARKLNRMRKYVWSTTLTQLDWENSHLMQGDMTAEVMKLKRQPGPGGLAVTGSGRLAQSLMQRGLVDEFNLWIHPVVLGDGKRLFANGVTPLSLRLVDSKMTRSGIAVLTYHRALQE